MDTRLFDELVVAAVTDEEPGGLTPAGNIDWGYHKEYISFC